MAGVQNPNEFRTLILDIGDVLFTWSAVTTTSIPPRLIKAFMNGPTWCKYERGGISQGECYAQIGEEFSLAPSEVYEALNQALESLRPNEDLFALVRDLKTQSAGRLRVFALSNISLPDYEYVSRLSTDWSMFDKVFPSALLGVRKPDLAAYEKVLREADIDPTTAVFVDDKLENVEAARQLGIHGIVFEEPEGVLQALKKIFGGGVQETGGGGN